MGVFWGQQDPAATPNNTGPVVGTVWRAQLMTWGIGNPTGIRVWLPGEKSTVISAKEDTTILVDYVTLLKLNPGLQTFLDNGTLQFVREVRT
jgi:hypothetical protein